MTRFIVGGASDKTYQALYDAGVIKEPPSSVARVVIDLRAGAAAKIYVELLADDSLIDVLVATGIDIIGAEQAEPE